VIVWQTSYGGSWDDEGLAVVEADNGSYIVAEHTYSPDFDIVGHHGSPGSPDALVLKYDADGNLLWQKCLGGTGGEVAFDMVATANGGCVLACSASSTNGDVIGVTGGSDFWLVGLDGSDNIIWQNVLGGSASDWRIFMDATADGGTVLCGETISSDGDVSFNHGVSDLWVVKLDGAGAIEWENSFGGSLAEYASAIVQNSAGGYYVCGQTKSNNGDVSGNHGGLFDTWVICLDSAGGLLWQRTMGGTGSDQCFGLSEDHHGGAICIGSSGPVDGDLPGNNGGGDLWVVDLDSTGNVLWNRNYGYISNDGGRCIKRSAAGGYHIAGSTYGPTGYETALWMMELDSVGDVLWEKSIGGSNTSEGIDLIIDSNNDLVVTGWSASDDGDVTDNHGMADVWTAKLTLDYATLTGTAFIDDDNDGIQGGAESGVPGYAVQNIGSGLSYFTGPDGGFAVVATESGTTTIESQDAPYHSFVPASHTGVFSTLSQQIDPANDFAMQADGSFNALGVMLTPVGIFRHLHEVHDTVSYFNVGNTTMSDPVLRFIVDPGLTYHTASVTPTSIMLDTLEWLLPTLAPYGSGAIDVFVSVPLVTPLGSTIASTASIGPVASDAEPANNTAGWEVIATGSADPNDILVDRSEVQLAELSPLPPYLNYVIRFQNTGNDTAFVVRIENQLPVNVDPSTFEFVSSSHPVHIDYVQHVARFNFSFPGIQLPDSTINEAESHGFLRYRVRPRSTLLVGDSVLNWAGIYFDYNAPVRTNTAHTVVDNTVGLSVNSTSNLMLSPNPCNGLFRLDAGQVRSGMITISDAVGRVVQRIPYNGIRTLDRTGHAPGLYFVALSTDYSVISRNTVSQFVMARSRHTAHRAKRIVSRAFTTSKSSPALGLS